MDVERKDPSTKDDLWAATFRTHTPPRLRFLCCLIEMATLRLVSGCRVRLNSSIRLPVNRLIEIFLGTGSFSSRPGGLCIPKIRLYKAPDAQGALG